MLKGINLFKFALQIVVLIVAVLSFFPCVYEYSSGSADMFTSQWKTGVELGNAKWIVLFTSIIELILLCFDKTWVNRLYKLFSFATFIVTLLWPVYLIAVSPGIIGTSYGYEWTVLGYIVLGLSFIPFIGFIIYERVKKCNLRAN